MTRKRTQAVIKRSLLSDVRRMIEDARSAVAVTVNAGLTILYWRIGARIRKEILADQRAEYAKQILVTLSQELMAEFGPGYSASNLSRMVALAEAFPNKEIVASLLRQLSWSHFVASFFKGRRSADYADDTDEETTEMTGGIAMRPGKVQEFGQFAKSISVEKMRDPQTYAIIGAAMEMHRVLGCGFLEPVYQEALAKEFLLRGIPFRRELELAITYKGDLLAVKYKPDFICYDAVIVELMALDKLGGKEKAQVINYLKATRYERGLLLNFGTARLEYERLILTARYSSADCADDTDREL